MFVLELSGKGGERSITARRFDTAIDSEQTVGLLSGVDSSPLDDALRVLREPRGAMGFQGFAELLRGVNVLVLDRDVSADPRCSEAMWKALDEWVRGGGRVVVFPQHGNRARWLEDLFGCTFERIDPLPVESEVTLRSPELPPARISSILPCGMGGSNPGPLIALKKSVSTEETNLEVRSGPNALVRTVEVGKGMVTFVAADLLSQFANYHPGAFQLLSNLLALRRER